MTETKPTILYKLEDGEYKVVGMTNYEHTPMHGVGTSVTVLTKNGSFTRYNVTPQLPGDQSSGCLHGGRTDRIHPQAEQQRTLCGWHRGKNFNTAH